MSFIVPAFVLMLALFVGVVLDDIGGKKRSKGDTTSRRSQCRANPNAFDAW